MAKQKEKQFHDEDGGFDHREIDKFLDMLRKFDNAQRMAYKQARRNTSARYASQRRSVPTKEFALLSLDPFSATVNDVKRNFRQASFRCHPDKGGTDAQMSALLEAKDKCLTYLGTK